ncbi:MAG TPA: DUF885 family protein [Thermoanaerobaculia bacterium]|nr:DUF885 family protein [Thermoanaerobaculia bacterium]
MSALPASPRRASAPRFARRALVLLLAAPLAALAGAEEGATSADRPAIAPAPALADLVGRQESEMAAVVDRFASDLFALQRRYDARGSVRRFERFAEAYRGWQQELERIDFASLGVEGRIDWLLLENEIGHRADELERERTLREGVAALIPFDPIVAGLQDTRRDRNPIESRQAAESLVELAKSVEQVQKALARGLEEEKKERQRAAAAPGDGEDEPEGRRPRRRGTGDPERSAQTAGSDTRTAEVEGKDGGDGEDGEDGEDEVEPLRTTKIQAHRASRMVEELQRTLDGWYGYHSGYHPLFTWWTKTPYENAKKALEEYHGFLRKEIVGDEEGEDPPIVGDPIGREALLRHLRAEMIAYSPEELIAIGRQELEWCLEEMRKAAREMGFGDDWKAALEKVKTLHVEPGEQPALVRQLADEAIEFVESRDLLTVPPLAKEIWRIEMMSPERQKMNPFFTGGEVISVSYPTDTMSHAEKLMSMRGNNIHFSRATVHHELIPGHHLQGFVTQRHNTHRRLFGTPFWLEGWALYWELRLYDLGFPTTPEDHIGMLFWRMHRCARIIGSLSFHLGTMTPQEWVDLLVDDIGHERENALGEVRRSLEGDYSPLYQVGYLIGGMQLQALQRELVESGEMTERALHDGILRGAAMPIEMVRARLRGVLVEKDWQPVWRFRGEPLG